MKHTKLIPKSIALLLLFFYSFGATFAQYPTCFHLKVAQAKSFFLEKNYKASTALYEEAFKIQPNAFPPDFLGAAKANAGIGNYAQSAKYLALAFQGGLSWEQIIPEDSLWLDMKKTKHWNGIISNYPNYSSEAKKKIDIAFFEFIAGLNATDQLMRGRHVGFDAKFPSPDSTFSNITDSLNYLALRQWIDKNGFPKYESIPYDFRLDLLIIMVHSVKNSDAYWEYYQPILKTALENGNLTPQEYALIIDGHYLAKHMGYYNSTDRKKIAIYDINKVDEYRREIGLESLEDYAKMRNLTLPDGYPKPPKDYYNCTKP